MGRSDDVPLVDKAPRTEHADPPLLRWSQFKFYEAYQSVGVAVDSLDFELIGIFKVLEFEMIELFPEILDFSLLPLHPRFLF